VASLPLMTQSGHRAGVQTRCGPGIGLDFVPLSPLNSVVKVAFVPQQTFLNRAFQSAILIAGRT
jgi:hypothetical protein